MTTVDFQTKTFLILYPFLKNSTTGIVIVTTIELIMICHFHPLQRTHVFLDFEKPWCQNKIGLELSCRMICLNSNKGQTCDCVWQNTTTKHVGVGKQSTQVCSIKGTQYSKNDFRSFLDMRIYCLIGIVIALSVFDLSTNQHSKSGKHLVDLGWIDSTNVFNFFDFPEIQPI